MEETVTVKISFNAEVKKDFVDELRSIVSHHMDYLIDFNENPEIKSVYGCELELEEK